MNASPSTLRISSGTPSSVTTSRPSIHQDCATSAGAFGSAAVLRRNDATFFAQNFEEVHARFVGNRDRLSVQVKLDVRHKSKLAGGAKETAFGRAFTDHSMN